MKKIKKSKLITIVTLIYFFVAVFGYFFNIRLEKNTVSNDWVDFATYLSGVVSPITAIGMVYITYLVYKLNEDRNKLDMYISKVVELYMSIENLYSNIKKAIEDNDKDKIEELRMKLKMRVVLIRFYLKRYPDTSHSVADFDCALNHLYFEPENKLYYDSMTKEFEIFCFYAQYEELRPITIEKNKEGNVEVKY